MWNSMVNYSHDHGTRFRDPCIVSFVRPDCVVRLLISNVLRWIPFSITLLRSSSIESRRLFSIHPSSVLVLRLTLPQCVQLFRINL